MPSTVEVDVARLEFRDLTVEVPQRVLLDGVSGCFHASEMVAVLGPSGSGKTSLLNILTGVTSPAAGEVLVDGLALSTLNANKRAAVRLRQFGTVFQDATLLDELSILENVALPARLVGRSRQDAEQGAREALDEVEFDGDPQRSILALSGGERQRVGIARALVNRPPVLVADEPTGALDATATATVARLFRSLVDGGVTSTVIVATHDPAVAEAAHRVFAIVTREIVEVARPASLHH